MKKLLLEVSPHIPKQHNLEYCALCGDFSTTEGVICNPSSVDSVMLNFESAPGPGNALVDLECGTAKTNSVQASYPCHQLQIESMGLGVKFIARPEMLYVFHLKCFDFYVFYSQQSRIILIYSPLTLHILTTIALRN